MLLATLPLYKMLDFIILEVSFSLQKQCFNREMLALLDSETHQIHLEDIHTIIGQELVNIIKFTQYCKQVTLYDPISYRSTHRDPSSSLSTRCIKCHSAVANLYDSDIEGSNAGSFYDLFWVNIRYTDSFNACMPVAQAREDGQIYLSRSNAKAQLIENGSSKPALIKNWL